VNFHELAYPCTQFKGLSAQGTPLPYQIAKSLLEMPFFVNYIDDMLEIYVY